MQSRPEAGGGEGIIRMGPAVVATEQRSWSRRSYGPKGCCGRKWNEPRKAKEGKQRRATIPVPLVFLPGVVISYPFIFPCTLLVLLAPLCF